MNPPGPTGDAEVARFDAAATSVAERLRDRAAERPVPRLTCSRPRPHWRSIARGWTPPARASPKACRRVEPPLPPPTTHRPSPRSAASMGERVTDLKDIRDRSSQNSQDFPNRVFLRPQPSILCAGRPAPADTAGLDPRLVVGLADVVMAPPVTPPSSPGSLEFLCGGCFRLDDVPAGTEVLIDGMRGTIAVRRLIRRSGRRVSGREGRRGGGGGVGWPGLTADGFPVAILANVQDGAGASRPRNSCRRNRPF